MKALTIRYVVKSTTDPEDAMVIATEALKGHGYRHIEIEQTRPFDEQQAISVYASADHDLKRPPGMLRTMRAAVMVEPEPEPEPGVDA